MLEKWELTDALKDRVHAMLLWTVQFGYKILGAQDSQEVSWRDATPLITSEALRAFVDDGWVASNVWIVLDVDAKYPALLEEAKQQRPWDRTAEWGGKSV